MKTSGTEGGHSRAPTDVDRLVGENIRRLRIQRNLTLAQLASELGISHQQLQKYETGSNRLSAGSLCAAAEALGVPVELLFRPQGAAPRKLRSVKATAMDELQMEGQYWLGRARSEHTLRQMVRVLKALAAESP